MVAQWNPNDPNVVGPEFVPSGPGGSTALVAHNVGVAQRVTMPAGNIDNIGVFVLPTAYGGRLVAEIYPAGFEIPNEYPITTVMYPVADGTINDVVAATAGFGSYYLDVDDADTRTKVPNTSTNVHTQAAPATTLNNAYYSCRLTNVSGTVSPRTIRAVRFIWNVSIGYNPYGLAWDAAMRVQCQVIVGGVAYVPSLSCDVQGAGVNRVVEVTCYNNPATNLPWTLTELNSLNTTGGMRVVFGTPTQKPVAQVNAMSAEVIHTSGSSLGYAIIDAPPVSTSAQWPSGMWCWGGAYQGLTSPPSAKILNTFVGSGVFTPNAGDVYTILVRKLPENEIQLSFQGSYRFISGHSKTPGSDVFLPKLDQWGAIETRDFPQYGIVRGLGPAVDRTYPMLFRRTSGSQYAAEYDPYHYLSGHQVYGPSTWMRQSVNPSTSGSYSVVKAWVHADRNQLSTRQPLVAQIKRTSDNTLFGGTGTVTYAQWEAGPTGVIASGIEWKEMVFQLSSAAALVGSTSYYVEFTSSGGTRPVDGWAVMSLGMSDIAGALAGYTNGAVTTSGGGTLSAFDALVTVVVTPAAPASATATLMTQAQPDDGTNCQGAGWDFARVTWPAPATTTGFVRWEVERSEDSGTTWQAIATTSTTTSRQVDDYTSRRGTAVLYRVRQVRNDGAGSVWRQAGASVTPLARGCRKAFVSNQYPTMNLVLADVGEMTYEFLDAADTTLVQGYNRDYQMRFAGEEKRGIKATFDVVIFAVDTTHGLLAPAQGHGPPAFAKLRAFQEEALPEVALLDGDGNRWYVDVQAPSGDVAAGRRTYVGPVTITELTDQPTVAAFP